jgi:hypothetical protein
MEKTMPPEPSDLKDLVSRCFEYLRAKGPSGGKFEHALTLIGFSPFGESFWLSLPFQSAREKHASLAYGRAVFDIEGIDTYVALSFVRLFMPSTAGADGNAPGPTRTRPCLLAVAADRRRSYAEIAEVQLDSSGQVRDILAAEPVPPNTPLASDVLTALLRDEYKVTNEFRERITQTWMSNRQTARFRFQ